MYNRKLDDARKHYRRAHDKVTEAHCKYNQTGRQTDRRAYIDAELAAYEAECEVERAEAEREMDSWTGNLTDICDAVNVEVAQ